MNPRDASASKKIHISVPKPCGFYLFLEMEGSAVGSIKGRKLSPNSEDCKGKGEYRCQK